MKKKILVTTLALGTIGTAGFFLNRYLMRAEPVTLSLWHPASLEKDKGWEALIGDFKKSHPDIDIIVSRIDRAEEGHFDLIVGNADVIEAQKAQDALWTFETDKKPWAYSQEMLAEVSANGKTFAIPFYESGYQVLFYDKDKVTTVPQTWDELAYEAYRSTSKIQGNYGLAMSDEAFSSYPFFYAAFEKHDGSRDAATAGFKTVGDMRFLNPVTPVGCVEICATKLFTDRKAPYALAGEWRLAEFQAALGEKLGISVLPKVKDKPSKSWRETIYLAASKNLQASEMEAVTKFIDFASSHDGAKSIFTSLGKVSSASAHNLANLNDPVGAALLPVIQENTVKVPSARYKEELTQLAPTLTKYLDGHMASIHASRELQTTLGLSAE